MILSRRNSLIFLAALLLFCLAGWEIFKLAWGSGFFLGRLSLKWALAYAGYLLSALGLLYLLFLHLWQGDRLIGFWDRAIRARAALGRLHGVLAFVLAVFPAWFVFYSPWGDLFTGIFTRLLLFILVWPLLAILVSRTQLLSWQALLSAAILMGSALVLGEAFVWVTDYPFAQTWSEGNRIWDFSLRFGSQRYNHPAGEEIFAWIDPGRQTLWGLPFVLPSISIVGVRWWSALVATLPYALLGLAAFRKPGADRTAWLLAGLWALAFLDQGPIYTPLVLAAILVAAVRRAPLWLALPVVFAAGYYAGLSRFSWSFAPGIWALILVLGEAAWQRKRLVRRDWVRAALLGLAGIWSRGMPILIGFLQSFTQAASAPEIVAPAGPSLTEPGGLETALSTQPYVWSRLLPNQAFPPGVLLALLLAALPLVLLLVYMARRGLWQTSPGQRVLTVLGLGAFLGVGLVASAKVGGGLDLHNLDMFLVALLLLAGLAFYRQWPAKVADLLRRGPYPRTLLIALVLLPALRPMLSGQPLDLPPEARVDQVLGTVRAYVACAAEHGEVLFMDERQLLTFGEVQNVPLVVDYEKKFVMDQALAGNQAYFDEFEQDLAAGRFALILAENQPVDVRDYSEEMSGDGVIEENNAWIFWVTSRLRAYYEIVEDYDDLGLELLMPLERSYDCP